MRQVNEMPDQGQFVALYVYNGQVWSNVYKMFEGQLYEYSISTDRWNRQLDYFTGSDFTQLTYFVKE